MPNLLTILTIRTDSERLPNKALAEIKSKIPGKAGRVSLPLAVWITRRLRQMNTSLVAATTTDPTDNALAKLLEREGIEVVRGSMDDVVGRMDAVVRMGQYGGTTHVFRMLGDMPFLECSLVEYAANRLAQTGKDAFVYALDPEVWPLYGSREFPFSIRAWEKIVKESPFREHPDQFFHLNRSKFDVLFHLPPDNVYFRSSYRLEVDYELDLQLVRAIADEVGMLAPLKEVVRFLDLHPDIARINADCAEKTGPLSLNTYNNSQRRAWLMGLINRDIMTWQGEWIKPPGKGATPIFCRCGNLLGHGFESKLYTRDRNAILKNGFVKCPNCMTVKEWREAIPRIRGE